MFSFPGLWIFTSKRDAVNFRVMVSGLQEAWNDDRAETSQVDGLKIISLILQLRKLRPRSLGWLVATPRMGK